MIAIMSAMEEEIREIIKLLKHPNITKIAGREFYTGKINDKPIVIARSKIGKVAAGITATIMFEHFNAEQLVFTGVAGTPQAHINVGDIVIAKQTYYHDLDATPLFPEKGEVPELGFKYFTTNQNITSHALNAASAVTNNLHKCISSAEIATFSLHTAKVHHGKIATGDEFVSCQHQLDALLTEEHDIAAIEMEGAAVAHVAYEFSKPYIIMRTISDNANESATIDFLKFIDSVAAKYSAEFIRHYLGLISTPTSNQTEQAASAL
ncbi:5'-methylthioadenosine/adenosylhomocysteine nucleosidase [Facilibium subflavum]|uniref:5'-methylthioadenosine/adenosylhomocysteine nucleosidase n=1 Tax=Facilibium subflavum TaxID=2219058 RepID=UPI000E64DD94|nr:5'-methylthioadenosine/adenosylhomocysteine nucleosidase [Facilibium subflavum]